MTIYFILFITGLIGGSLAGIVGVGTGLIMVMVIPIVLRFMGVPEELIVRLTIANTIFATMCSALINNFQLIVRRTFYWKETLIIAAFAGISASFLLLNIVFEPGYTSEVYNLIIIIMMIFIIVRTVNKLKKSLHQDEKINLPRLITAGFSGGTVAALTGLGGGSIIIPLLNLWMKVDIKKAKVISYGSIFIIGFILSVINLMKEPVLPLQLPHYGHIILSVSIPLVLGVLVGSPLGLRFSEKLPSKTISILFLLIISIVIIKKCVELIIY